MSITIVTSNFTVYGQVKEQETSSKHTKESKTSIEQTVAMSQKWDFPAQRPSIELLVSNLQIAELNLGYLLSLPRSLPTQDMPFPPAHSLAYQLGIGVSGVKHQFGYELRLANIIEGWGLKAVYYPPLLVY